MVTYQGVQVYSCTCETVISIIMLANAKALAHPNLENRIQKKFKTAAVEIPLFEGTKLKQLFALD